MPKTIGDVLAALKTADANSKASSKAAIDADAKAKADADTLVSAKAETAADLAIVGDVAEANGDGTFTAYFASTGPEGFRVEVLKGLDAVIADPVPTPTPVPTPAPPAV